MGLHARPAAMVAQEAAKLATVVRLGREGGTAVDARSVLSILTLDARQGDELVLSAEGPDALEAVVALASVIERDLDSEP